MGIFKSISRSSITAIFVTLMLSCNSLSLLLSFVPGISAIIVVASFAMFLLTSGYYPIACNLKVLFVFIVIIALGYVNTFLSGGWCTAVQKNFLNYIIFGVPFLYVSFYSLDYKKIILYLMLVGIILTPINIRDFMYEYLTFASEDAQMRASYNILFYVVPSIIVVLGDYSLKMKILAILEFLVGGIFLISFGSKGAIIAFLFGVVLVSLYKTNKPIKIFSFKIISVALIGYVLLSNFESILLFINDTLERYGLVSSAIPELLDKISSGDNEQLTSGRTLIYKNAMEQIYSRPLFGYGISDLERNLGAFPHNLFIQLLYEGGIAVFIPYVVLFVLFIKKMNAKYSSLELRFFYTFILSAGLIRLMFSHNYWESQLFWFSIGIVLKEFSCQRQILFNNNTYINKA